jgi:hypothetical protein
MKATDNSKAICKPVNVFQKLHINIKNIIFEVKYLPATFPSHIHIGIFKQNLETVIENETH